MVQETALRLCLITLLSCTTVRAEPFTYQLNFDAPMSWADDVVFWGMGGTQKWEIAQDEERTVLRIDGADNGLHATNELRTLQINHEPGASVILAFDIKALHVPHGATLTVRHFDGYCTGLAFREIADDAFAPFPKPLLTIDSEAAKDEWKQIILPIGPLQHAVLTLAFHVRQLPAKDGESDPGFVLFHLDSLQMKTQPSSKLGDPGFDWDGNNHGTRHFKASVLGQASVWCDYAEQVDVNSAEGETTHFTLMQFRDTASQKGSLVKHNIWHMSSHDAVGGRSVVALSRESSGGFNAVSWGVRQTIAYSAFGFKKGESGKLRISMRMANDDDRLLGVSRVQLGVDPQGGMVTKQVLWSEEVRDNILKEGWRTVSLEIERPRDATALTIYFRHRDGLPRDPEFKSAIPEAQSMGSRFGCTGLADWVLVEKLP